MHAPPNTKQCPRLLLRSGPLQPLGWQPHDSRGLTLLEVLIALIVLSVGLIGVAALTLKSIQNVHSSLYTSLASAAALDYEERLWMQAAGLNHGECPSGSGHPLFDGDDGDRFLNTWTAKTNTLGLPVPLLSVNGTPGFSGTGATPEVSVFMKEIEISWAESRFGNLAADREQFRYIASAPCRRAL